jgi:hypothetical protein
MDRVARLPARDRQDIFAEAAAQFGIRPTIIEKDFWVCFVLKLLFVKSSLGQVPRLQGRNIPFEGTRIDRAFLRRH